MSFELFLFLSTGVVATISAAMMIYARNAVHSALFLVINFGCIAFLYLMLDAPFISMVQIAVYAGAIMVLFLFVIMLLGAEQSSDVGGSFRWVTAAGTILALAFAGILGGMVVSSGGLELPEAPGDDPVVRVVHGANIADPATITLSGAGQTVELGEMGFGDVSDFVTVPAGDYTISIVSAAGDANEYSMTLAGNDVVTAVAYGDTQAGETVELLAVSNSFADSGSDRARVTIVNAYSETPLSLVDIGANAQLDTIVRDGDTVLRDVVIASGVAYGTASSTVILPEGEYLLQFVVEENAGEYKSVYSVGEWQVEEGTEQVILLVPDYGSSETGAGYRARLIDREQNVLVFPTAEQFGSPTDIGQSLFIGYLLPVNLVGFLLLVSLIGVIVLTRPAGLSGERRSTVNRRRKVSRPLVSVISQQTGGDVTGSDAPRLEDPASGD